MEIDLTPSGCRALACPIDSIPPAHRTTCQICVRRGWTFGTFEVCRAPLSERLPVIAIPLGQTDADVPRDLQALVDQCFTRTAATTI